MGQVTMNDVAKAANVSQTCVSMVVNGKADGKIPKATQKLVLDTCRALGYRKNRLAGSLNSGKGSSIIGVIADGLLVSNFAHDIILGCQDAAHEQDKTLMLISVDTEHTDDFKPVQIMLDYQVDSIIYVTTYYRKIDLHPLITSKPVVLVNCYSDNHSCIEIVPDDYLGSFMATEFVLQQGHRNVVYMSNSLMINNEKLPATVLREAGYVDACKKYGVKNPKITPIDICQKEIKEKVISLLTGNHKPTAIICYNDRMATTVFCMATQLGLSIPNDLSIIGYDNQRVITDFLTPKLTTIALPHYQMGYQAIYEILNGTKTIEHKIKPELIKGNSTAII
jgi:LacI family transcriptional regulator